MAAPVTTKLLAADSVVPRPNPSSTELQLQIELQYFYSDDMPSTSAAFGHDGVKHQLLCVDPTNVDCRLCLSRDTSFLLCSFTIGDAPTPVVALEELHVYKNSLRVPVTRRDQTYLWSRPRQTNCLRFDPRPSSCVSVHWSFHVAVSDCKVQWSLRGAAGGSARPVPFAPSCEWNRSSQTCLSCLKTL